MPAFFRRFDNSISEFNIIVAPVSKIKCSLEVFVELGHDDTCFEFVSVMGKDSELGRLVQDFPCADSAFFTAFADPGR